MNSQDDVYAARCNHSSHTHSIILLFEKATIDAGACDGIVFDL